MTNGVRRAWLLLLVPMAAWAQAPAPQPSPRPVVSYEYDAQGNLTRTARPSATGALANSASYDSLQRLRTLTDPRAAVTRLDYGASREPAYVIDPRGLVTSYQRDGFGMPWALVSPDTGAASSRFDAAGNLRTRQDSRGAVATYAYDALNRMTSVTFTQAGQPSQVFGWGYDQTGPNFGFGVGRLTSTSFPGGGSTHAYDEWGGLAASALLVANSAGATLALLTAYSRDAAGRIVSITYPSGAVVSIPHSGGLPTSLSLARGAGAPSEVLLSQLQHEPFGPLRSWRWHFHSGPQWHERVFDTSGRMIRHPLGGALRDIVYDAADRIVGFTHLDRSSGTATAAAMALNQSFGYDEAGRLTQVAGSTGTSSYAHDANGNRILTSRQPGGARNHTIAAHSNRLLALDNPPRSLAHDAAGNTITDQQGVSGWTATYDASGRLSRLQTQGVNGTADTTYLHDAAGVRVAKRSQVAPGQTLPIGPEPPPPNCPDTGCSGPPGQPSEASAATTVYTQDDGGPSGQVLTVYVHDEEGRLLGEYNGQTGAALREYIWLQGMPLAVVAHELATPTDPVPVLFIHTDHLDTPRVVLDRHGVQRWSWVGQPFGDSSPVTNPVGWGDFEFNLRMPGQYYDKESGLFYNLFRSYEPTSGRYTQSDSIGLAGGVNTYTYVGGDPVSRVDPDGRLFFVPPIVWWGVGAIGVGGAAWWTTSTPPKMSLPGTPTAPYCKVDEFDKKICDDNYEHDQDACHERFGNGFRGGGFTSNLSGCLAWAEVRRNACYKGERDPGPFRGGDSWSGGRNR